MIHSLILIWPSCLMSTLTFLGVLAVFFIKPPHSYFTTVGVTLLLAIFLLLIPEASLLQGAGHVGLLWASALTVHLHDKRSSLSRQISQKEKEENTNENKMLLNEITFYENKRNDLIYRSDQRHRLAKAARDLGDFLHSEEVFQKLMTVALDLFPNELVQATKVNEKDQLDRYIMKRKKSVMIPNDEMGGDPVIAVPVFYQQLVSGILRISRSHHNPFSMSDFHVVDALGTLASMAVTNASIMKVIEETAQRDDLTGLLTPRAFKDQLEFAIAQAKDRQESASLILVDVDHFKSVNDSFGHPVGDELLQAFSATLICNIPEMAIVGRAGGEEFGILLPGENHNNATLEAERLQTELAEKGITIGTLEAKITGSFGVATYPEDGTTGETLTQMADQRLYQAKNTGRNKVCG